MLEPKQIGEFIAQMRKTKGLTQSALAEMLCVTHQAVSKWENGAALPDIEVLVAMSKVFGVPVDGILDARAPVGETKTAECAVSDRSTEGTRADLISENMIVVYGSRWFDSKVEVDQCAVFGDAHFHSPTKFGSLEIAGRATFRGGFVADTLAVLGEAKIDGGTTAGGIAVRGDLTINGGVSCRTLENYGRTVFGGGVECDEMRNAGAMRISGGISTTAFSNAGEFDIGGGISTTAFENSNKVKAGGGVSSKAFVSGGDCSLGGGVKAETVRLAHRFMFGGGLSAAEVSVLLSEEDCVVRSITAKNLMVKGIGCGPRKLSVKEISVEHGEVEYVHAERVTIQTGKIGEGCKIGRLECGKDVEITPGAEVTEVVRSVGD